MGCRTFWIFDSKEHFGWLVCYIFSGVWAAYLLMIFNTQVLVVAEIAADAEGNLPQFFGIRWSNAITLPASIGAFSMLILGPLIGSMADYTPHRKLFGGIAVVVTIGCFALHIFISNSFLGVILAFSILGNVSYLSVYMLYRAPYLPELAVGPEVAKLSAKGYLIMILSQIFFMGFFVGIGRAFGGTNPYNNMRSACIAAVIITSVLALIVLKYMGYREASSKLQPGENILTIGFKSVFNAFKEMSDNYTQLRRFLFFSSFANASFNAALALGTTYLIGIGMSSLEVSAALSVGVIFGICGPLVVYYLLGKNMSIRKIMLMTVVLFFCVIMLLPLLASIHLGLLLIIMGALGISLGMWLSCGQAFFAELCPGGKEATFTGCYMFANKVCDWMPPLIFSIVNQVTGNITAAYYTAVPIFIIVAIFICYTINMETGAKEIKNTLVNRRLTLKNPTVKRDKKIEEDEKTIEKNILELGEITETEEETEDDTKMRKNSINNNDNNTINTSVDLSTSESTTRTPESSV
jgi:MFS-type transporter involved in bile tolerance (Atg22 family)